MPDQSGMAFVVVTHLSPSRVSQLHEVVARYTSMPVRVAQDAIRVEPDHGLRHAPSTLSW